MDVREQAQQKLEARSRAKRDKFYLANEVLGFDFQPETHAELFGCFVQWKPDKNWDSQSDVKDRMILWSRGHYKTTAVVVEVIQAILNFPNVRVLLMQGSLPVTRTLLKQIAAHFAGEAFGSKLPELFPEFCGSRTDLDYSVNSFTVPARTMKQLAQATVTVASPKSVKTGQHYECGFFDDLVNDQNHLNPKLVQKVQENFTLAQALIDPGGYRFVTGTRYAFGDLYEQILRWQAASGKWVVSVKDCWTDDSATLADKDKKPRFPRFTKKAGELGGFTTDILLQMQEDDPANFACQYLNKPIHSSLQSFTEALFESSLTTAELSPALSVPIMVCDLASTNTDKADDNVIAVGKTDGLGIGYLVDLRGGQWAPMDMAMHVIDMALRHRPHTIYFEGSSAAKYFQNFLMLVARQRGIFLPIEEIKVDNKPDAKNARVLALAGIMKRGKFKIFKGLANYEKLVEQACQFPKGRHGHDDYPDTAALLYQQLGKMLLALPFRRPAGNPILALISDRDSALQKVLTQTELQQVNNPDETGLEL